MLNTIKAVLAVLFLAGQPPCKFTNFQRRSRYRMWMSTV